MNTIHLRSTALHVSLMALGLTAVLAQAPATKPAADAPKPPVHKPEQSLLNRAKQDERTKTQMQEAIEDLRKAAKNHEAAEKEIKRIDAREAQDNPDKVIDALKDKLDPEALKKLQEKAKELSNSEEVRKTAEALKKKVAESIKPKSAPTTTPPEKFGPSTFDQVPAPTPAVAGAPPVKQRIPGSIVYGDKMILPPSTDPSNPAKSLPPSDPRTRTYIVIGRAYVRTPTIALDADRIECIASPNSEGTGLETKKAPKPKTNSVDPVQKGINAGPDETGDEPFDRLIATGRVNIVKMENGEAVTGKGGSLIYDKKSGRAVLTDWPQARKGQTMWIATRKDATIVIVPKGQPSVEGCKVVILDEEKVASAPSAAAPPTAKSNAAPKAVPVE